MIYGAISVATGIILILGARIMSAFANLQAAVAANTKATQDVIASMQGRPTDADIQAQADAVTANTAALNALLTPPAAQPPQT